MSVTYPKGFVAAGVAGGIRSGSGPDCALVVNEGPLQAAAVQLTSNRFCAAPVRLTRSHAANGVARAVVLNAGCANACTGSKGAEDALAMAQAVASAIGCAHEDVLVCSTGMIGENLPMDKVLPAIAEASGALASDDKAGADAAAAIITTDTHAKPVEWESPDGSWRIGAMIKGAGMLAPGMATMLCVMTTDADVQADVLDRALADATRQTLNRVDSDGCMSTNDTVVAMASGASGASPSADELLDGFKAVMDRLSHLLIEDAEGVNHMVEITVCDAASEDGAEAAARAISRSNLVKCAIYGNDPNWGRIVSELGTVPEDVLPFDYDNVSVTVNGVTVFAEGTQAADRSDVDMSEPYVAIDVAVNSGTHSATVLSNDLTHDYIHINADYSS